MSATSVATPPAAPNAGDYLDRVEKACELMRCDAVLEELQACRSNNRQLQAWFTGRRQFLRELLGILDSAPGVPRGES